MNKKMKKTDVFGLSLLTSICIVLYISRISVTYGVLAYSLVWTWSLRSMGRLYEFYFLNFIMNIFVIWVFVFLVIIVSPLKNISAKLSKILSLIFLILLIYYVFSLMLSDIYIYFKPSDSRNYIEAIYEEDVYCRYWVIGIDNDYLGGVLCNIEK